MNFFKLISIENFKLWKRLSTKVMALIMVVLVIGVSGLIKCYSVKSHEAGNQKVSATWKAETQKELAGKKIFLKQLEQSQNKIERMTIGSTKKSIAEDEYAISHDIAPDSNIWGRVTDIGADYGKFIALMLIIACATVIAGEFTEGTMKSMISRPYSRAQILSAKLIAVLLYGVILLVITQAVSFLTLGILFGFDNMGAAGLFWTGTKVIAIPAFVKALAIFGLDFLKMVFYISMAFALSAICRSRSIATGFSLFMFLVGGSLVELVAVFFHWGRYLPFAVTDFSNIVVKGAAIEGTTLLFGLVTSAIYAAVMFAAGYIVFQKRDI